MSRRSIFSGIAALFVGVCPLLSQQPAAPGYVDTPRYEASGVTSSVDAGGYSSAGQARTQRLLIDTLASLRLQSASKRANGSTVATYVAARDYNGARAQVENTLRGHNSAELHSLLGDIEEVAGNRSLAAAEYERAAQMAPNELNVFNWGVELLTDGKIGAAITTFNTGLAGNRQSEALRIGLAVAEYSAGQRDDAVRHLIEVTDLNGGNAPAALFLGRVCLASRAPIVAATQRLQRLSATAPDNADVLASYAACLSQANENAATAEQLLNKAIALEPNSADAQLQLGDLYMQQDKFTDAIRHYREVVRLRPEWADAHYRLARAYISAGQNEEAQREFTIHDRLRKQEQRRTELWDQR